MKLERSPLDSVQMNLFRSMAFQEALAGKMGGSEGIMLVQNSLEQAERLLPVVDEFFSSNLTSEVDLIEYAVRAKSCLEQIETLKHSLTIFKEGKMTRMDKANAIAAIAYLEGELQGLKYTMEEMQGEIIEP